MRSLLFLLLFVMPSAVLAQANEPGSCITVKALGCYLKLPANVLLLTDSPTGETSLSLSLKGSFRFVSLVPHPGLTEKARATRGHLEVIEYDQPGEREPVVLTVITDGSQQLELRGDARAYSELVVTSCLANIRPNMGVFRSLSRCTSEPE